jgi:hypothetical protein
VVLSVPDADIIRSEQLHIMYRLEKTLWSSINIHGRVSAKLIFLTGTYHSFRCGVWAELRNRENLSTASSISSPEPLVSLNSLAQQGLAMDLS